jgi:hypothetical protein
MAETILVNNRKVSDVDTITTIYTAPTSGGGTVITAFTVSNSSTASVSYKAYILDVIGDAVDPVVPLKIVVKDKFDSAPSIINQVITSGGTLRVENSTGDSLSFYVSGREL